MGTHNVYFVAKNTKMLTISLDERGWGEYFLIPP